MFRGPVHIPQRYGLREEATSIVLSCSSALGKSHRLRRRHALVTLRLWQCHGYVYSRVHSMNRKATLDWRIEETSNSPLGGNGFAPEVENAQNFGC